MKPALVSEKIIAAAIKTQDGAVHFIPRPGRHHHIIQAMSVSKQSIPLEGFVTSEGRFVGRVDAMKIAASSGQLKRSANPMHYQGPALFSEDLW